MSLPLRLLALSAALLVASTAVAGAQERPFRPRVETFRVRRPPYSYFKYRLPAFANRDFGRIRLQREDVQRRALERSLERMDRFRGRHLELQDRAWRKQLEIRDRAFERTRERMDQMFRLRPFKFRSHYRTI